MTAQIMVWGKHRSSSTSFLGMTCVFINGLRKLFINPILYPNDQIGL